MKLRHPSWPEGQYIQKIYTEWHVVSPHPYASSDGKFGEYYGEKYDFKDLDAKDLLELEEYNKSKSRLLTLCQIKEAVNSSCENEEECNQIIHQLSNKLGLTTGMEKKELAPILEKHSKWLKSEPGGERADLTEANLVGLDLKCVNLRKAILYKADLFGSNLSGADLREANLVSCNLEQSTLSHTDLQDADLKRANLAGAYLLKTNLNKAKLRGAILTAASFLDTNTTQVIL